MKIQPIPTTSPNVNFYSLTGLFRLAQGYIIKESKYDMK